MASVPPIATLLSLPDSDLTTLLDTLFEPSTTLHALLVPILRTPHASYTSLLAKIRTTLREYHASLTASDRQPLHEILGSHPRLGEPKKETLSEQSAQEQKKLQEGGEEEARLLTELNAEYEARFPGLRYVVFVNGRGRGEVMEDMRARIAEGSLEREEGRGLEAMCDIALDRARKLGGEM
ncbi:hypothetical protein OQA88_5843 [Cercophora sp. LCS_1]